GTTADPKGVLHSHQTLLAEARSLGPVHGIGPQDTVLMPSPLTHISGMVHALLVPAALGSGGGLMGRWDAGDGLRRIAGGGGQPSRCPPPSGRVRCSWRAGTPEMRSA